MQRKLLSTVTLFQHLNENVFRSTNSDINAIILTDGSEVVTYSQDLSGTLPQVATLKLYEDTTSNSISYYFEIEGLKATEVMIFSGVSFNHPARSITIFSILQN